MNIIARPITVLVASLATVALLSPVPQAEARPAGVAPAVRGHLLRPDPARGFDPAALGAQRDRYEAWQRSVPGGGEFYTTRDRDLRAAHAALYAELRDAAVGDRLSDGALRGLVDELLAIGERAREARGAAEALPADARALAAASLQDLESKAVGMFANEVDRATLTPKVNRLQVSLEELFRWGVQDGLLSTGQQASLRRKFEALEKREESARKDGEVDDRELETLLEDALELARDTGEILRR